MNGQNFQQIPQKSYNEGGWTSPQAVSYTHLYKFDLIDYTSGNVEITEEKNVEGYVSVRTDSIHAYEAEDSTRCV